MNCFAQSTATLSGSVRNVKGAPLPYATIALQGTSFGSSADDAGNFEIHGVPYGEYVFVISSIGYITKELAIQITTKRQQIPVINLTEDSGQLAEIIVQGSREATIISQQPITTVSTDISSLSDQVIGTEQVMKRLTGVVIRQSGGLGDRTEVNLNGLTGNAVPIYYDGIPFSVFGGGIAINNIPVEALSRVDVYKGVVPVEIATDALGGSINLIPKQIEEDNLSASYSIGSFNTHRFTLNGGKVFNNKISLSLTSFANYSDNDYLIRNIEGGFSRILEDGTRVTGIELIDVKRPNSQHTSSFINGELQLQNLAWADQIRFSLVHTYRQDGLSLGLRHREWGAAREAVRDTRSLIQRIDYRKTLFDNLSIRYFGVISDTRTSIADSTSSRYDWHGIPIPNNNQASELSFFPTLRKGNTLGTAHRFILGYELGKHLNITASNYFEYLKIDGSDPVPHARITVAGESIDPNTIPSHFRKNVFGLELAGTFYHGKLTPVLFYKNYEYSAESIDILQRQATVIPTRRFQKNDHGYGFGIKYQPYESFFIRANLEQTSRIPTEREIFGDFASIVPNFNLKPENSENWNLGINFNKKVFGFEYFNIDLNTFIRNQANLIRITDFGPENSQYKNEEQVEGMGIEVSMKAEPIKNLDLAISYTNQKNEIINEQLSGGQENRFRLPNTPQLFYNAHLSYRFENTLHKSLDVKVHADYYFINRYSINAISKSLDDANPKFIIPTQRVFDAGVVLIPKKIKGIQVSFMTGNLFNTLVYDNFKIPRPGRNYTLRVNYSL